MQVFIARGRISYVFDRKKLNILIQDFIAIEGGKVDHVGTAADGEVVTSETTLAVEIGFKDVVEGEVALGILDGRVLVAELNEFLVVVDADVDTAMVLSTVE